MTLLGLLACTDSTEDRPDSQVPETAEPGWVLSDPIPCADPAASLSWTPLTLDPISWSAPPDAGTLALSEGPEGVELVTLMDGKIHRWDVHGKLRSADLGGNSVAVVDLDLDGTLDQLLVDDRNVVVVWGGGERVTLYEATNIARDAVVGDYDGDGRLDVAVVYFIPPSEPAVEALVVLSGGPERQFSPRVYSVEETGGWGMPFDGTAIDVDGDLDLDLYVCNDFGEDLMSNFLLENRDGEFVRAEDQRGTNVALNCMGSSLTDVNGDGWADLYLGGTQNHFLLLGGSAGFIDATAVSGLPGFEPFQMVWGSHIVDLDNDGLPDLLGATSDFTTNDPNRDPDYFASWALFQGPDGVFEERDIGLPKEGGGRAVLGYDANRDGIVDVALLEWHQPPTWLMSDHCTANNWLEVEAPLATRVSVWVGGEQVVGWVSIEPGTMESHPAVLHLGLGEHETVDRVVLSMPNRGEVSLEGPFESRRRVSWSP